MDEGNPEFLIALQYHDGDRHQAIRLLRVMNKMFFMWPPFYRVQLMIVRWPETREIDMLEFKELLIGLRPFEMVLPEDHAKGHPAGCNAMACEVFARLAMYRDAMEPWRNLKAVLMLEPDCVPMHKQWLTQLFGEWEYGQRLMAGRRPIVCGCYRKDGVDRPHVNGVAVWSADLAKYVSLPRPDCGMGWDSAIGPQLDGRIFQTSLISNLHRETNVSPARLMINPFTPLVCPPPVLVHGVKDDSAWKYAAGLMPEYFLE